MRRLKENEPDVDVPSRFQPQDQRGRKFLLRPQRCYVSKKIQNQKKSANKAFFDRFRCDTHSDDTKIEQTAILGDGKGLYFATKFSPNNKYLACAHSLGRVDVFDTRSKQLKFGIYNPTKDSPFTCVRWRDVGTTFQTMNVVATTNTEGEIQHWHVPTGKQTQKLIILKNS